MLVKLTLLLWPLWLTEAGCLTLPGYCFLLLQTFIDPRFSFIFLFTSTLTQSLPVAIRCYSLVNMAYGYIFLLASFSSKMFFSNQFRYSPISPRSLGFGNWVWDASNQTKLRNCPFRQRHTELCDGSSDTQRGNGGIGRRKPGRSRTRTTHSPRSV